MIINIPNCEPIIVLKCMDKTIESKLAIHFFPYISYEDTQLLTEDFLLIEQKDKCINYNFKNKKDTIILKEKTNAIMVIKRLMQGMLNEKEGYLFLHGACMAKGSDAIALLASTGGGKSTLAAFMLSKGYQYITDDCVIIRLCDLRVMPYRKMLELRAESEILLESYGVHLPLINLHNEKGFRYVLLPEQMNMEMNFSLKALCFMSRDINVRDKVDLYDRILIQKMCIDNSYFFNSLSSKWLKISSLASKVPAYVLNNQCLETAVLTICKIMEIR